MLKGLSLETETNDVTNSSPHHSATAISSRAMVFFRKSKVRQQESSYKVKQQGI